MRESERRRIERRAADQLAAKREARFLLLLCILGISFLWGLYAVRTLADSDLLATKRHPPKPAMFYLLVAIAGTVICVPRTLAKVWKIERLAAFGIKARGTITRVSYRARNLVAATVKFNVRDKEYVTRQTIGKGVAVGDAIMVLYDPVKPRRCDLTGPPERQRKKRKGPRTRARGPR